MSRTEGMSRAQSCAIFAVSSVEPSSTTRISIPARPPGWFAKYSRMRESPRPRRWPSLYAGMTMESSGGMWIIGRSFARDSQHDLTPAETADERHESASEQLLLRGPIPFLHDSKQFLLIGLAHGNDKTSTIGKLIEQRLRNSRRGGGNQ